MEPQTYATWHKDPEQEARMSAGHLPYWRHLITTVPERDLTNKTVLDFGCNQGGFLRLLHELRPFRRGIGVDIARDSVAIAKALTGTLPIDYEVATGLAPWSGTVDVAFSYEVIYLVPDLVRHAAQMKAVLREGGVYYAVTGCHTDCHLWPMWRKVLAETSTARVQEYSPEDFVNTFAAEGFAVSVRKFGYDGFVPMPRNEKYYPRLLDALTYAADNKLLFRMAKRAA